MPILPTYNFFEETTVRYTGYSSFPKAFAIGYLRVGWLGGFLFLSIQQNKLFDKVRTKKFFTKHFEFSKSVAKQKSYDILKSEPMGKWPMGIYCGEKGQKWHQN